MVIFMGLFVIACCLLPGLVMLLFPAKAFHTETKPRWLGIPILGTGLVILYAIWPLLVRALRSTFYP